MMNILYRACFIVICAVAILPVHATDYRCGGRVKCIPFQECKGMYGTLTKAYALPLRKLAKKLHCGFKDKEPLVCCPPVLSFVPEPKTPKSPPHSSREIALPSQCGLEYADRIYSGQITELDEHPWMALLQNKQSVLDGFYCGGSLISSRYVVTAAHCIQGPMLPSRWKVTHVRLGEWNTSSVWDCFRGACNKALDVPVEQSIVHEGYERYDLNQFNDIALLRLAHVVPFSDFISPICLPTNPSLKKNTFEGWELVVAGWGKTGKSEYSPVKLKLTVPVVKNPTCKIIYKLSMRDVDENQICAGGEEHKDSCRGDSGGPLMGQVHGNWMLLGVVSYGPSPCGSPGWPGVYTRVTNYVDWILANLRA
ncbi:CLIP domain-containing serine protease 2-like [Pararge aegeria]|uniref:CLIP domain-containing serine protease n=1 Tax=Pararge aegeria aegeria TaxID=348720 RepID=A0A8S4S6V1_9NEOP|nr:CLIP domain-containing serine protease 2-like [Pararge aegeria]CAH2257139.1 jg11967 [Pararge aegeria aegeria]